MTLWSVSNVHSSLINDSVVGKYSISIEVNVIKREVVNNEKVPFFPAEDSASHNDLK